MAKQLFLCSPDAFQEDGVETRACQMYQPPGLFRMP